jgi:hypothetical protein
MSESTCPVSADYSLPVEVLERIVKELVQSGPSSGEDTKTKRDWAKSLGVLSLVSPSWTEICQRKLYETAHFCPTIPTAGASERPASLFSVLIEYPHLGKFVKTLNLALPSDDSTIRGFAAQLLLMAPRLTEVQEVKIEDKGLEDGHPLPCLDLLPIPENVTTGARNTSEKFKEDWFMLCMALNVIIRPAKSLTLKNLRVSGSFLGYRSSLENLTMVNSIPHTDLDLYVLHCFAAQRSSWILIPTPDRIYERRESAGPLTLTPLTSLTLDVESVKDFGPVFWVSNIQSRFPFGFEKLKKLSLPIPLIRQQATPSTVDAPTQLELLSRPIALQELHLWSLDTISPFTQYHRLSADLHGGRRITFFASLVPFENLDSPLRYLNPSSCSTLTKLTFEARFNLCLAGDVIEDPYLGLFHGGSFGKLTQLEELVLKVWISGSKSHELNDVETFGNQWLVLDQAIAPSPDADGARATPHPNLRSLKLTFGLQRVGEEDKTDHLFEVVNSLVFDRLHGLKALQAQGNLGLTMECAAFAGSP